MDRSHFSKFDGSYFNIWKHRLTFIFKAEKLWLLVDEEEVKPIAPTITQIIIGTPLPTIGARSISAWKDRDVMALTIINNSLDNVVALDKCHKTSSCKRHHMDM